MSPADDEAHEEAVAALPAGRGVEPERARRKSRAWRAPERRRWRRCRRAQRDAFLLQQEAGLSLSEIAELTGVGVETVKSRLRYAVNKLRNDLSDLRDV